MARPKSMSDFSQLLDQHTPLGKGYGVERPRKKPSISLAAGLIMNADSNTHTPRSIPPTPQIALSPPRSDVGGYSENLFYAYAQKSGVTPSPPYILTFCSALVCAQWWELVRAEYPESTRAGPQLFILKGDDMQDQIQDNPRFYHLRDKWFYTASDGASGTAVLPLQDYFGNPVTGASTNSKNNNSNNNNNNDNNSNGSNLSRYSSMILEEAENSRPAPFDLSTLTTTLTKMSEMISSNSSQIQALSVAQSSGLQSMQAINESNSTQIKSLADNQAALQSLVDKNASHYIALSNSSFQSHESVKKTLDDTATQVATLSANQTQMTKTCASMMKTIESVGKSMAGLGDGVRALSERDSQRERDHSRQRRPSNAASTTSSASTAPYSGFVNRISPGPRKLNRKIRGVWYEYDSALLDNSSPSKAAATQRP
ncbi:hypothetical protein K504DRAFT_446940 [Pleomassaria siparia CBS 279.74]|uniref:Uncharacterized protein n=1 Tax=Pleomassaria siparia CBS 279.74 TaxID=1314801 RepID=A0A6G1K4Q0_9PLEO|nr:hypothetical protein K504DRAFT_446940 [Pleomassaria siparia CBS 279.74]